MPNVQVILVQSATATNGGVLTCSSSSLMLSANSNVNDASYSWTGPNSFSSSLQNPTISLPGTYTVQATNATGSASASIVITENSGGLESVWEEKFNLNDETTSDTGATAWTINNPSSGTFHVKNNRFEVENIGLNQKGIWASEVIDISSKKDAKVSVHLFSEGELEFGGVDVDFVDIFYKLDGGQHRLFSHKTGVINNNSPSGDIISSDPLNGSTIQIFIEVRASKPGEFYYFDNVKVISPSSGNIDVSASVNGILNCSTSTVNITGETSVSNANYAWSGPNGFTASSKNIEVNKPGEYTLTVTNTNGCSRSTTVTVIQDIVKPNVSATVDGVTLSGASTTPGVTFNWTGPNNFTSSLQNPIVNTQGTYILAQNPQFG